MDNCEAQRLYRRRCIRGALYSFFSGDEFVALGRAFAIDSNE